MTGRAEDPGFLHGTDHSGIDRLAATVVTDVQHYWTTAFPETFGEPWQELDGGFFSVDTTSPGSAPPCSTSTSTVEGNAYYCASVDAIAWDRTALLPVLRERYGETAVAIVLAHEIGHAVQQRSGTDRGKPARIEASADCHAGAFTRWVADGNSARLHITEPQLDDALRALIVFRDPITSGQSATDAHGTAFDRVTAFQDGYRHGPGTCSDVAAANPRPTGDETERAQLDAAHDIDSYFAEIVERVGGHWQTPGIDPSSTTCPARPVAYCARPPAITVDRGRLAETNYDIGDQAGPTLLASRFALAALADLNQPTIGPTAGERATCLTGSYTASRAGSLSPGDLDETISVLLSSDQASRDGEGANELSGFDRVTAFRAGYGGGHRACGIPTPTAPGHPA
ncbi:neutral zinc metallopeptidase [Parasphingorhabdus pacifica]